MDQKNGQKMDVRNGTKSGGHEKDINPKWLKGKLKIMAYCRISEAIFIKWLALGLPAVILDGSYRAHTDNLDHFLKYISRSGEKKYDSDAD